MERRLSILQKRSRDTDEQCEDSPLSSYPTPENSHSRLAKHDTLTRVARSDSLTTGSRRQSRSRSSSLDPGKGQRSRSSHAGTPNSLEVTQKAPGKRSLLSEDLTPNHTSHKKAKTARSEEREEEDVFMVAAVGYDGLGLQLPSSHWLKCGGKEEETVGKEAEIKGMVIMFTCIIHESMQF